MLECSWINPRPHAWWSPAQRTIVSNVLLDQRKDDYALGYADGTQRQECYAPLARNSRDYRRGYLSAVLIITNPREKEKLLATIPN